ncbi:MAG: hypothetical protein WBZ36_19965 [Candidatus Nitrosopolaris sp.]
MINQHLPRYFIINSSSHTDFAGLSATFTVISADTLIRVAYAPTILVLKTKEDSKSITVTRQAWFTLGILSSTLLVVFFSETMLLPAIPEIMKDFNHEVHLYRLLHKWVLN